MNFSKLEYDYIEYYVEDARHVANWHVKSLGFKIVAYKGPETGDNSRSSFFLVSNRIRLVITSTCEVSSGDLVGFLGRHGYGVKRIAYLVDDVHAVFERILSGGAIPIKYPSYLEDEHGGMNCAAIKLFDDSEITLVDYNGYGGVFMPGYKAVSMEGINEGNAFLNCIDHVTYALHENETTLWLSYMNNIFRSRVTQEFARGEIASARSGLALKVLRAERNDVINVLVEPDNRNGTSQIQEFLDAFNGTGVQHIAFSTTDIISAARSLKDAGVEFNEYPLSYYESLSERLAKNNIAIDIDSLKQYGILCDFEDNSYLLQIFTKPISGRPTIFYEIIQRVGGYTGFGAGNIENLFQSVEVEQSRRIENLQ